MESKQIARHGLLPCLLGVFLLAAGMFLPGSASGALQLEELAPLSGPAGTPVTLTGSGFDPARSYEVKIDGTVCPVFDVSATAISFSITSGAQTGYVSLLEDGGTPISYLFPFTVTRVVQGTWTPPQGVARAGYGVGSAFSETTPGAEGAFDVTVPDTGVSVVAAAREDTDPAFLAVVTSADTSVVLDAVSTAKALVFLSPLVATQDDALAQSILSTIGSLSETDSLASLIESKSADGVDYLNDPQVESAMVAAIEAYLRDPVQSPLAFRRSQDFESSPEHTHFKYVNPDPDQSEGDFAFTQRFTGTILPPTEESPDRYTFKLSAIEGNPLEWTTSLYRLDKNQFPRGLESIDQMVWWDPPERWDEEGIGTTYLHSKLETRRLDLVGAVAGYITKGLVQTDEGELDISANRPGVYMARSFSGNVFNGTSLEGGLVSAEPRQEDFINNLVGGREEWRLSLYANLVIIALDVIPVSVESILGESDTAKLIFKLLKGIMKSSAAVYQPGKSVHKSVWMKVLKESAKTIVKEIAKKGIKALVKALGKTIAKSIDITGKVSKALQAVERTGGLFNPEVLAVDSAVIVIGYPFEPVIRTFSPRRGHHGATFRIEGYNFDPRKDEITGEYKTQVRFGSQSTDPDAPPEFEAEVIHATEKSLLVKVPDGAETCAIWVFTEAGFTSTGLLERPYSTFEVVDPLTEVTLNVAPDPVLEEGVMTIEGGNFPVGVGFLTPMNSSDGGAAPIAERGAPYEGPKVIFDEDPNTEVPIQNMTETEIVVKAPASRGTHSVRVRLGNSMTQPASFTVGNRVALSGKASGATISITSVLDEDDPDDPTVTLREAMMIAAGLRGPRLHDPCESLPQSDPGYCGWQPREVDQVSGSFYGAGYADYVKLGSSLSQESAPTVFLSAALPPPDPGDMLNLGTTDGTDMIVDGSALGGGADAWPLAGRSYTSLWNVTFRNFPRHGIYLSGGATGNLTYDVRIENCGGTGVFFDQDAANNILKDTKVTGARPRGLHGLHMTGQAVRFNEVQKDLGCAFSDNAQYGVLIENGANHNLVCPGRVVNNALEGVMVRGENTDFNVIGRNSLVVPASSEAYHNGKGEDGNGNGAGIHLGPGVDHTLIRYFHVAGNAGDGILLQGPGCDYNQIQSVSTGLDLSSKQNPVPSPNGANGIHLKDGAAHNLIGGRLGGMFGWRNAIAGNSENGILIEGEASSYNTINQSHIGSMAPASYAQNPYLGNGQNGIVLRGGTHHNIIGDRHKWLDNHLVAHTNGAGILVEGQGTDKNLIAGNQIGVEHTDQLWEPPEITPLRSNRIGIHLKDGPRGNVIGQMGDPVPRFEHFENPEQPPPFPSEAYYEGTFAFFSANAISNNTEAGILIENCGGELGLEGKLEGANVIINNPIGSTEPDDLGTVYPSPNGSGIKLVGTAQGNRHRRPARRSGQSHPLQQPGRHRDGRMPGFGGETRLADRQQPDHRHRLELSAAGPGMDRLSSGSA